MSEIQVPGATPCVHDPAAIEPVCEICKSKAVFSEVVPKIPEEVFDYLHRLDELAEKLTGAGIETTVSAAITFELAAGSVRVELNAPKEEDPCSKNKG
jgi:hypothetical protein